LTGFERRDGITWGSEELQIANLFKSSAFILSFDICFLEGGTPVPGFCAARHSTLDAMIQAEFGRLSDMSEGAVGAFRK
jgi:hypothetical protein